MISVIIPSFEPQNYIYNCLDSLRNQTFSSDEFEIVLVLNGCCEPYKSQIEAYVAKYSVKNIHLIQIDTPGVSNARNVALDYAHGEYICFLDDDDYISNTYLEELYSIASPDTLALSNVAVFYEDGFRKVSSSFNREFDNYELKRCPYWKVRHFFSGPWMKMIHKSIIAERRFDVRFTNGEDSLFMFLISNKIEYVNFSSKNAIYYRRIRSESLTTKYKPVSYVLNNRLSLILQYTKIYFASPFQYNIYFYITRVLASIRAMILFLMRK